MDSRYEIRTARPHLDQYVWVSEFNRKAYVIEDDHLILRRQVEEMQKTIEKQQELIAQQREMLTTLWYHPGMPGATQALEDFRAHANGNDQGRED